MSVSPQPFRHSDHVRFLSVYYSMIRDCDVVVVYTKTAIPSSLLSVVDLREIL